MIFGMPGSGVARVHRRLTARVHAIPWENTSRERRFCVATSADTWTQCSVVRYFVTATDNIGGTDPLVLP